MANQPGKVRKLQAIPDAEIAANGGLQPGDAEKVNIAGLADSGTIETDTGALVRVASQDGDPRGNGAVDLQRFRSDAARVASGTVSAVLSGHDNAAAGDYAVVIGGNDITLNASRTMAYGNDVTLNGGGTIFYGYVNIPFPPLVIDAELAYYIYGLRSFFSAPNTPPNDDDIIENGSVSFYIDEAANNLVFRVRYSDGSLKTGTISLT